MLKTPHKKIQDLQGKWGHLLLWKEIGVTASFLEKNVIRYSMLPYKFHDPEKIPKKFRDPEIWLIKFHDPELPLRPGLTSFYVPSLSYENDHHSNHRAQIKQNTRMIMLH